MSEYRRTYGWAGTVKNFLETPTSRIHESLIEHMLGLFGKNSSYQQDVAWEEEIEVLRNSLRDTSIARLDCLSWGIVLEYELPLEGGRRPDVVIIGDTFLRVIEFKQDSVLTRAAVEQAAAYARDLSEYHSESHNLDCLAVVVPTKATDIQGISENTLAFSPDRLSILFASLPDTQKSIWQTWLEGDYAPLPSLIEAARTIFTNEKLPRIKRAESYGVWDAVNKLREISISAKEQKARFMAFVSGVPGAGKTLVGLQLVHQELQSTSNAVFLSGNGPLVNVLRGALKSTVAVKDLHGFIKTYALTTKIPKQHIIVFDEAQRAWDAQHMLNKNQINKSEPELLVSIGEKIPDWSALIGLIGHGQEINTGEEAGIKGWVRALSASSNSDSWTVFAPPRFSQEFENMQVHEIPELDLSKSLRSRKAEDLHEWIESVLIGNLSQASRIAHKMISEEFNIFVTRDLELAKNYLNSRYSDDPDSRYGILASAKDKTLPRYGIKNGWNDTKLVKERDWYNNPKGVQGSCCSFESPMTEFGAQGLELDMAIVAWGDDFLWNGSRWELRKSMKSRYPQKDPHKIRMNSYRVLLSRSRDGLVLFVPDEERFNQTEIALLASGAKPLTINIDLKITA